jgi:hypothetical protein
MNIIFKLYIKVISFFFSKQQKKEKKTASILHPDNLKEITITITNNN